MVNTIMYFIELESNDLLQELVVKHSSIVVGPWPFVTASGCVYLLPVPKGLLYRPLTIAGPLRS